MSSLSLSGEVIESSVRSALAEDIGKAGDITSKALFDSTAVARANIICRSGGIVAGIELAHEVFNQVGNIEFASVVSDGDEMSQNALMASLTGSALSLLSGERTALNFLGHLGGIGRLTKQYVDAVRGTNAKVCCTRKTVPGLRYLQKYAVRCGGGVNHRFNLSDAVLIKDNHVAVAGGVEQALSKVIGCVESGIKIEIEVDTLDQLNQVLMSSHVPDVVMLDNMSLSDMKEAVDMVQQKFLLEASGNVTLSTITEIAKTGVDYISTSQITQSAPALDMGLDIEFD